MNKFSHVFRLGIKELISLRYDSVLLLFMLYAFSEIGRASCRERV